MRGALKVRTIKTASGAKAVQIIHYAHGKRSMVRHIGSAHTDNELASLYNEAELTCEQLCKQLSLPLMEESPVHTDHL